MKNNSKIIELIIKLYGICSINSHVISHNFNHLINLIYLISQMGFSEGINHIKFLVN
jgi:hypothetical protein